MRKKLIAIGSALVLTLVSASAASALTVGGPGYVGVIIDGIPANPADEVNYINGLIKLPDEAPTQVCPDPGSSELCNRVGSNTIAVLPVANLTGAFKEESAGALGSFTAGDFEYVLAKYGNDGSRVWYIGDLDGSQTLPGIFDPNSAPGKNNNAISHYSLYNATTTTVPDGGTTAALLGLSLVGLGMIRRRINL